MANSKVTVETVKKAETTVKAAAEKAETTVKAAAVKAETTVKAAAEKVEPAVKEAKTEAKKAATKAKTTAKSTAAKAKTTATKAVKKAKKEVVETSVIQFHGKEYSMDVIMTKVKEAFKAEYKNKTIAEINVYVKPEEDKAYYVINGDCVGSVEL